MSQISPRLRAERGALPDPTGLAEAIAHRRSARRDALQIPGPVGELLLEQEELFAHYSPHYFVIQAMPGSQRATAT